MPQHGITSADAAGIRDVLNTLLDPLRHPSVDEWRRDVAGRLRPVLGADALSFQLPHPDLELLHSDTLERTLLRTYESDFLPELVRTKRYARRMEEVGVGNRARLWGRELRWFYRSAFYNELLKPARLFDPVWVAVPVRGQSHPAALVGHRVTSTGRRFGRRALDIMRILRPALAASVNTLRHLHRHRDAWACCVDAMSVAALVVGRRGRILHQNPKAKSTFQREGADDTLRSAAVRLALDLMEAGNEVPARGPAPARRWVRTRLGTYLIGVTSLPFQEVGAESSVLVLVEEAMPTLPGRSEVARRWRMTPRQAEVALLLAARKTGPEIARGLGISLHTARHHVEAVMARLGVRSRRMVADRMRSAGPQAS